jgi:hypothetical protein
MDGERTGGRVKNSYGNPNLIRQHTFRKGLNRFPDRKRHRYGFETIIVLSFFHFLSQNLLFTIEPLRILR